MLNTTSNHSANGTYQNTDKIQVILITHSADGTGWKYQNITRNTHSYENTHSAMLTKYARGKTHCATPVMNLVCHQFLYFYIFIFVNFKGIIRSAHVLCAVVDNATETVQFLS